MAKTSMKAIWVWVIANIFGQIVNEIESGLIYNYYGGQECYPAEVNYIFISVKLISPNSSPYLHGAKIRHSILLNSLVLQSKKKTNWVEGTNVSYSTLDGRGTSRCTKSNWIDS